MEDETMGLLERMVMLDRLKQKYEDDVWHDENRTNYVTALERECIRVGIMFQAAP